MLCCYLRSHVGLSTMLCCYAVLLLTVGVVLVPKRIRRIRSLRM
eukprot:SAG22_NODE_15854_length_338_cov_1.673640_2_plen_43_part_01